MNKKFGWGTLVTTGLVLSFLGFALGFNYPLIEDTLRQKTGLTSVNQGLPDDLTYNDVEEVYDVLRQKYDGDLSVGELLDGAKEGLAEATGDPYTVYLDQEAAKEFKESLEGSFSGIGAQIGIKEEKLIIISPLEGTPADQSGLRPGDHIAAVNGESTDDMSLDEAVSKIRGQKGTEVTLTIIRNNNAPMEVKIKRDDIEVPSVTFEVKQENIGYISLNRFGPGTTEELRSAINELKQNGAKKYILDLRNNGGGLLNTAVDVTDVFMGKKVVVEERRGNRTIDTLYANKGGLLNGDELVVLLNQGSASASEIVAGALQDHGLAQVVGETSFGKGSVQELVNLGENTFLKVTVARWYTPAGRNISENGISPDVKVEFTEEDYENDRDPQLKKAIELLSG